MDKRRNKSIVILVALLFHWLVLPLYASASPPSYSWHPIHEAVCLGNIAKVKGILDKNPTEIEAKVVKYHFGEATRQLDVTPLSVATAKEQLEIVKLLLERGARIECGITDNPSAYPLHLAAINGNLEIARLLLEKGAHVNASGTAGQLILPCSIFIVPSGPTCLEGVTALHLAADCGHIEMAKLLIAHGAAINALANNGETPLHAAAKRGDLALVKLLIEMGADPAIQNNDAKNPLEVAQSIGETLPSRKKAYEDVIAFLANPKNKPLTPKARQESLAEINNEIRLAPSKDDSMLEASKTTVDRNEFRNQVENLVKAKDGRVVVVVDSRLNDFDPYLVTDIVQLIYPLDLSVTRYVAKKWLAAPLTKEPASRPKPKSDDQSNDAYWRDEDVRRKAHEQWDAQMGVRFWASLILLKGDSADQDLAVGELRQLFNSIGLGTQITPVIDINKDNSHVPFSISRNLAFKVEELLKNKRKDVHELACRLGSLQDGMDPYNLRATKILFNAGCEEALKMLTNTLRSNPQTNSYHPQMVDGKEIKNWVGTGDIMAENLMGQQWRMWNGKREIQSNLSSDWGPLGFKYAQTEPEAVRKIKREKLAQWLEMKFQEIKQGKRGTLKIGPEHP